MDAQVKQVESLEVTLAGKDAMIRRLTSDLAACHTESVKLVKVLLNVAVALQLKKESNWATIKALKEWAKKQCEAQQVKPLV